VVSGERLAEDVDAFIGVVGVSGLSCQVLDGPPVDIDQVGVEAVAPPVLMTGSQ
jgi:hypothetical protein